MVVSLELAKPFGMSLPAVSKHLKVLESAKLVQRYKDGRIHRFSADSERIDIAKDWIETYQQFWEQQFDALGHYLEDTQVKEKK